MGDMRADIKIVMSLYGKDYTCNMWINYDGSIDGVDRRVAEFFSDAWVDAQLRFADDMAEYYRREDAREIETMERAELARLQAKYAESPRNPP